MTELVLALVAAAFFYGLYWAIARPQAAGGKWLWLVLTLAVLAISIVDVLWSLGRAIARTLL